MIWFLAECGVFAVLLLGLLPLRIDAQYSPEGGLVILGWIWRTSVRLYPRPRQEGETAQKGNGKKARSIPQMVLYKLLLKNGLDTLFKVMEHMKLELLSVHVTAGGSDPFQAASVYAGAGMALEALDGWAYGRAERADLRADVDLTGGNTAFSGRIRLRAQAHRVVSAIFRFGTGYLRGYSQYKRSAKTEG